MAFIAPQSNMLKRGAQTARKRCRSPRGRVAAIDRITHGEGAISELKRHGADRARCRGTAKLQIQLLLAATAINLKRLTTHAPAAENAGTSNTTAARAHLAILNACLRASPPTRQRLQRLQRLQRQAPRPATSLDRQHRQMLGVSAAMSLLCGGLVALLVLGYEPRPSWMPDDHINEGSGVLAFVIGGLGFSTFVLAAVRGLRGCFAVLGLATLGFVLVVAGSIIFS